MFKYSRKEVLKIANDNDFLTNNTEKVLRLCQILAFINKSGFGEYLSLKGGTAINVFLLDLIRLSVDIDFDFSANLSKEEVAPVREEIKKEILSFMANEGYSLSGKSKFVHTLDSFVFSYNATAGSGDVLKIEINYSDRVHVFDLTKDATLTKLGEQVEILRLSNDEVVGSKMNALIVRTTPRDLYDVYNILKSNVSNIAIARKVAIFYVALGSDIPLDFSKAVSECLDRIALINYNKLKKTLIPVLRKSEKTDVEEMKSFVSQKIRELFKLDEAEKEFIGKFNNGVFDYKLLFGEIETNDLSKHPMVIWKINNIK